MSLVTFAEQGEWAALEATLNLFIERGEGVEALGPLFAAMSESAQLFHLNNSHSVAVLKKLIEYAVTCRQMGWLFQCLETYPEMVFYEYSNDQTLVQRLVKQELWPEAVSCCKRTSDYFCKEGNAVVSRFLSFTSVQPLPSPDAYEAVATDFDVLLKAIEEELSCPVHMVLMQLPYLLSSGHSVSSQVAKRIEKCPLTRVPLKGKDKTRNYSLHEVSLWWQLVESGWQKLGISRCLQVLMQILIDATADKNASRTDYRLKNICAAVTQFFCACIKKIPNDFRQFIQSLDCSAEQLQGPFATYLALAYLEGKDQEAALPYLLYADPSYEIEGGTFLVKLACASNWEAVDIVFANMSGRLAVKYDFSQLLLQAVLDNQWTRALNYINKGKFELTCLSEGEYAGRNAFDFVLVSDDLREGAGYIRARIQQLMLDKYSDQLNVRLIAWAKKKEWSFIYRFPVTKMHSVIAADLLHEAIKQDEKTAIDYLLNHCHPDLSREQEGCTPLAHLARSGRHWHRVRAVIANMTDSGRPDPTQLAIIMVLAYDVLRKKAFKSELPLRAIISDLLFRYRLSCERIVHVPVSDTFYTSVHFAVEDPESSFLYQMLENDPALANTRHERLKTPLSLALKLKKQAAIDILLAHGATSSEADSEYLLAAAQTGDWGCVLAYHSCLGVPEHLLGPLISESIAQREFDAFAKLVQRLTPVNWQQIASVDANDSDMHALVSHLIGANSFLPCYHFVWLLGLQLQTTAIEIKSQSRERQHLVDFCDEMKKVVPSLSATSPVPFLLDFIDRYHDSVAMPACVSLIRKYILPLMQNNGDQAAVTLFYEFYGKKESILRTDFHEAVATYRSTEKRVWLTPERDVLRKLDQEEGSVSLSYTRVLFALQDATKKWGGQPVRVGFFQRPAEGQVSKEAKGTDVMLRQVGLCYQS